MTPSTIATWANAIIQTLQTYSVDVSELMSRYGFDSRRMTDPHCRIPVVTMTLLWRDAVALSGDEAFGLRVANQVSINTFHALGYAALASRDFQEIALRLKENSAVISDVADVNVLMKGRDIWFCIDISADAPEVTAEALDAFMGSLLTMGRRYVGMELGVSEVRLQRQTPKNVAAFEAFFKAPVRFNDTVNALVLPFSAATRLMPGHNPALLAANEQVLKDYLLQLNQSLVMQVKAAIETLLPDEPLQKAVAEQLSMSVRKLQRQLAEQQTSFQELLDSYRKQQALMAISAGRKSLKTIAFDLGFANQSAFTRAFKRWTGKTPRQVAQQRFS
ncbi:MAG: AraC family transcriptional regulator [Pseudomonadales bacterium]|nr:AraC family transcriptional regulator [Pseudomonadales bacterium]